MNELLLKVDNLKTHFPVYSGFFKKITGYVKAVDGVSFVAKQGEVIGIVGESGCGKSTLARTLLKLVPATSGEAFFKENDLFNLSGREEKKLRKEMQVVFQDPYASLNPRMTVGESLSEPILFHQLAKTPKEALEKAADLMQQVGLSPDFLDRYPHEFSGGQQQRICIGRALSLHPELIICDEAVSALDVSVQAQILNLLIDLKERFKLSYLFISHDLSVVKHICDRVIVLYLGQVMEEGPAKEVFENPRHPYTQALLASIPAKHPKERGKREALQGEIPSPMHPPKGCPFHTRCPKAVQECQEKRPDAKKSSGDGRFYCIFET